MMTDEELKALISNLAVIQTQMQAHLQEQFTQVALAQAETDRQLTQLTLAQAETDKQLTQLTLAQVETDKQLKETDKQLKELGKQLGGLGNKFGSFTEGMAFPSMTKVLREHFQMEVIATRVKSKHNNRSLEVDVLAYANSEINEVYIVEMKSYAKPESIEQILKTLATFPQMFPEHNDKRLYGILAAVDLQENLQEQLYQAGIYLAMIHDEVFQLQIPAGFQPRCFN
jgi:septal ring factor EnvC (AmiA/AmiB activator)